MATRKPAPFRFAPVGSRVLSSYWQQVDIVLAHVNDGVLVRDEVTGRERWHCTAFSHPRWDGDYRADQILGTVDLDTP